MSNLVPGPTMSTKPCRYWLNGGCQNLYCPFLHPPHGTVPAYGIAKSSIPCHFFLRGNCGRGANCSFMHAPPSALPEQPQKNLPPSRLINHEDNTPPPQEQNNNPSPSEESSDSDVSFDVLVGDNPSYFLQGADWYGSSNDFMGQIETGWYGSPEYYSSPGSTLHRPSPSGRKRPLEQEAESKIRFTDVGPVTVPCTEMPIAHDEGQNDHSFCAGILSSRLRGRVRFPKRSTSATAYHSKERRDSPNGYPVQHAELVHGRCDHERESGFTNRTEINASDFPSPKSLAELKRAKTGIEQNDNSTCSDFEGPNPLCVLWKKKKKMMAPSGGDK